ncbi:MAG: LysR family transcriptional regulator [Pseudomonadota bacterium]
MDILTGMRTFTAVVLTGSFTAAGERLGISKALTSKYVGQLEEHLGVRLLNRTTRHLNVTETGKTYYERCKQILDDVDELEAGVRDQHATPTGKLSIAAPVTFGELHLTGIVTRYLEQNPNVQMEMVLSDRYVNIVDEGFDLAIRIGQLDDSSLIAKRIAGCRMVVCATPQYLLQKGRPSHPKELSSHCCIVDTNHRATENWRFREQGKTFTVKVGGQLRVNNAISVRDAMLASHGIGFTPIYAIKDELHEGKLSIILKKYEAYDFGIFALYPHNRHLTAKVRSFVDFLGDHYGSRR